MRTEMNAALFSKVSPSLGQKSRLGKPFHQGPKLTGKRLVGALLALGFLSAPAVVGVAGAGSLVETFQSWDPGQWTNVCPGNVPAFFLKNLHYQCANFVNLFSRATVVVGPWPSGNYAARQVQGNLGDPGRLDDDDTEFLLSKYVIDKAPNSFEVEFYLPQDLAATPTTLPHVLVMSNFKEVAQPCSGSCPPLKSLVNFQFYAVIAGVDGSGPGVAIERALANGSNRCTTVLKTSRPFGSRTTFPAGVYKLRQFVDPARMVYGYRFWRWEGYWRDLTGEVTATLEEMTRPYNCSGWNTSLLPPGRQGVGIYWFPSNAVIYWDNLKVTW